MLVAFATIFASLAAVALLVVAVELIAALLAQDDTGWRELAGHTDDGAVFKVQSDPLRCRAAPATTTALAIIQPRACGPCRHCCVDLEIEKPAAIAHAKGVPCPRLGPDGCTAYDARPVDPCQTFTCLWLRGAGDDGDRPDLAGFMMHEVGGDPVHGSSVAFTELRAGVLDDGTDGAGCVKEVGFHAPVIVNRVDGRRSYVHPVIGKFTESEGRAMLASAKARTKA